MHAAPFAVLRGWQLLLLSLLSLLLAQGDCC
jgi:hypothetical protein